MRTKTRVMYCPICMKPTTFIVEEGHNYETRRCTECGTSHSMQRGPKSKSDRNRDDDWR